MAGGDERTEGAPAAAGFHVIDGVNVVFRHSDDPTVAVMVCAHADERGVGPRLDTVLSVRGEDGEWTAQYLQFRAEMGMPSRVC
jgi:hypothetical protein